MSRRKKRNEKAPARAIPLPDWLPPESSPNKCYSQLVFADAEEGSGPLSIVGRELQLVWYETSRDREIECNGKLVCVLEFRDCRRNGDHRGERYQFAGLLLEDMSGEYRNWVGHQEHQGRPFAKDTHVLETAVRFSVALQERMEWPSGGPAPATQPFTLHQPDVEELSSPQVDMLFDVMTFLHQSMPGMELMDDLRARHVAERVEKQKELATSGAPDL